MRRGPRPRSRHGLLTAATMLWACQPGETSPPPVDTDTTSSSGSTTGGSGESVDDTTADSTTAGTDTGPVDCERPTVPDDIVLDSGAAVAFAGDVARTATIGGLAVACGEGFVQPAGGAELAIDGHCTGLDALGDDRGVLVTDTGATVLFSLQGGDASELDVVTDAGTTHRDVAVADGSIFVASGTAGLQRFDPMADSLGAATAVPGASDAHGIASVPAGLLVADGRDGARLVDPDGGGSLASLDLDPGEESKRIARGVVVDADRAYVLRGAFGLSVVDLRGASLSLVESIPSEGIALDVAPVEGGILVATGASLARYALEDGSPALMVSRQTRPDYGEAVGAWIRTLMLTDTGTGLAASVGASMVPVTLGSGEPQPLLYVERATYSFWADEGESTDSIVTFENRGAVPLAMTDLAADPFAVEPLALDELPGCPDQYVIEADDRGLVQLTYADPSADVLLGSFSATTDASDDAMFDLRVEVNRSMSAIGRAAPAFETLTHEGNLLRVTDFSDRVVFVKVFNET